MRRIVHISDLHFGKIRHSAVDSLLKSMDELDPHVVIISGDITQRARQREFQAAREFIKRITKPVVVVPGNHDVPLFNLVERFSSPLRKYKEFISDDLMPYYTDDHVFVLGLSTAGPFTVDGGRLGKSQIDRALEVLQRVPDSMTRIVVSHHPLDLFGIWRKGLKLRRPHVHAPDFTAARVDMYLSGHLHESRVRPTQTIWDGPHHSALLVQAGTTTSTRLRDEGNAFNVIEINRPNITVRQYCIENPRAPQHGHFNECSRGHFCLGQEGWIANN